MMADYKSMRASIQFESVGVSRGAMTLFSNLSFTVEPGDILWVQGDNGIGKTTVLKLAAGLARPDTGRVVWRTEDSAPDAFDLVAYQGHLDAFKPQLTAEEALSFWAKIYMSALDRPAILDQVGLSDKRAVPVGRLSAGQKRRLALARLLISQKPLWVMDEPGAVMDIAGAALIDRLIMQHSKKGGSVILASHSPAKSLAAHSRRLSLLPAATPVSTATLASAT